MSQATARHTGHVKQPQRVLGPQTEEECDPQSHLWRKRESLIISCISWFYCAFKHKNSGQNCMLTTRHNSNHQEIWFDSELIWAPNGTWNSCPLHTDGEPPYPLGLSKFIHFHLRKCIGKWRLKNGGHLVLASVCKQAQRLPQRCNATASHL